MNRVDKFIDAELKEILEEREKKLPSKIKEDVKMIKRYTKKPVCVGFGISKPSQVKSIFQFADGVIVGSAVIKKIEENLHNKKKILASVAGLTRSLCRYTP